MSAIESVRFSFVLVLLGALQGCFTQAVSRVDQMVDVEGLGAMNVLAVTGERDQKWLRSYGRIAGRGPSVDPRDARLLWSQATSWGELRVLAWEPEASAIADTLGLGQADADRALATVVAQSLGHSFEGFPALSARRTTINVFVAPYQSGRRVRAEVPIEATAVTATFIVGVDLDDRKTPISWWLPMLDTVAHELLHVELALVNKGTGSLDEETAAYLTGLCAQVWMTLDSGRQASMTVDVSQPFVQQTFPGISEGQWAPRADQLAAFKGMNVSGIGRSVAYAWIYHRYATAGSLNLGDRSRLTPLLEECQRYGNAVPRFLEAAEASPAAR